MSQEQINTAFHMQTCNQLHVSIHMGTVHSFIKLQLNSDHKSSTSRQQQNIEYLNQVHSGRYQTHLNSYSNRVHPFKSNINLSEIIFGLRHTCYCVLKFRRESFRKYRLDKFVVLFVYLMRIDCKFFFLTGFTPDLRSCADQVQSFCYF